MISIDIPGFAQLELAHLVLDYNGTVALDGVLLPGIADKLFMLASDLEIHVITADTFGFVKTQMEGLPIKLCIIPVELQAEAKFHYVTHLGCNAVVAIGNGRNDHKMLKASALGIALIQQEGGASSSIAAADIVSTSVLDALELLQNPKRLLATLRS
ncbi:MAG: ATPase P [Betaproteobacteria bacterium]